MTSKCSTIEDVIEVLKVMKNPTRFEVVHQQMHNVYGFSEGDSYGTLYGSYRSQRAAEARRVELERYYGVSRLPKEVGDNSVTRSFTWKDRSGVFHSPREMSTRHIFMTLMVIWNHVMPEEVRIYRSGRWVHHAYKMSAYYSDLYLATAIVELAAELFTREIDPDWQNTIDKIRKLLGDGVVVSQITKTHGG